MPRPLTALRPLPAALALSLPPSSGVLRDKNDIATKFSTLDIRQCRELQQSGVIAGGMIPKVECCVRCLSQGVAAAHIIDGKSPHSILMELLTDTGVGTMIVG